MRFRTRIIAACAALLLAPLAGIAADKAPAPKAAKTASEPAKTAVSCEAPTGTRIKKKRPASCDQAANQPSRSYSAEELEATGKLDLVEALSKVEPAVR